MKPLIIATIIIVVGVIIFTVIEEKIKYKDYEKEELSEQDKTMKTLRILIYIIIALLLPTLIYKILLWTAILKRWLFSEHWKLWKDTSHSFQHSENEPTLMKTAFSNFPILTYLIKTKALGENISQGKFVK